MPSASDSVESEECSPDANIRFGFCRWFDIDEELLVTWTSNRFVILDLKVPSVLEHITLPFLVEDVASHDGKIFVLGRERTLKLYASSLSGECHFYFSRSACVLVTSCLYIPVYSS